MPELTPRRQEVLQVLYRLAAKRCSTTQAELAETLGVSKNAAHQYVTALRALGLVVPGDGRHGTLQLTDQGLATLNVGIPVYGEVAAGQPGFADQAAGQAVSHLEDLLDHKQGDFLLQVRGESMTGIGVYPGDYVLVRPAAEVLDGEVAVVAVLNEQAATLKRVFREGDALLLVSENPAFAPMRYPADEVQIQGRMIGLLGMSRPRSSRPTEQE